MRYLLIAITFLCAAPCFSQNREVTDSTGRVVKIPTDPQRIVALHEALLAVPMLELGANVVGVYGRSDDGGTLLSIDMIASVLGPEMQERKIPGIGPFGNIDLEKIRALEPDLIIGTEYDADKADRLSAVAPVYLLNSTSGSVTGIEGQKDLAELLELDAAYAAHEADYRARVDEVREALPLTPEGQTYLALFIHDQINVVGNMSGLSQALKDLGYVQMPIDQDDAGHRQSFLMQPISPEVLGRLNPDLLIVMNTFAREKRDADSIRADFDKIMPGWEQFLQPAREGRVVYIDSGKVTAPSFSSAEHTLDAIEAWAGK